MYIIAIAWLYVTVLMAATEKTVVAGIFTFIFYGLLPCAILLWVLGVKHRRFKQAAKLNDEISLENAVGEPDGTNPKANE
ncbi:MAG: hypothetical protein RIS87_377 [Pseudomonadota bacterium]|jgi:hypothetical protein